MAAEYRGPLADYRVLDLSDEKGLLCGRMLGDLGADVIQVEPPGGNPARRIGPFYHDIPHPEKSLFWYAYGANKRSITLDIETADGQEILKNLIRTAHFLVESFPPGYLDKLGLSYASINKINPGIIMASISPFGQSGPYKDYKASDIVCMAMGGLMKITGDPDRPPLRVSYFQAYLQAATYAAVGAMIAHYHRGVTGTGQHVDSAVQPAILRITHNAVAFWLQRGEIMSRAGQYRVGLSTAALQRQTWPCQDGFISFQLQGGTLGRRMIPALLDWIETEGIVDDNFKRLKEMDWPSFDMASTDQELFDLMSETFGGFFLNHTKAELYEGAMARHIMLYPVASPSELLDNAQLQARDYWVQMESPEPGINLKYPGAFCRASETPPQLRFRAPLIGEHNREIYEQEMGMSPREIMTLQQARII
ncbi:CaiB/BaiF CoA transferase family protein [Chloroflexota bacterium]